ncbi:MAG: energy transducer TonB [Chthoniobacteraceae bacterium]
MPYDLEDREPTFFMRHRLLMSSLIGLVIAGIVWGAITISKQSHPVKKTDMVITAIMPPPPPPPMTPPPPPPEQKIEEKQPEDAPKPDDKPKDPPKPKDEAPPSLGTNLKGDGNDAFGLSGNGNGGMVGGGGDGDGQWRMYGEQVKSSISQALRANPRTRSATFNLSMVRLWVDATGHVRATFNSSTGDTALDSAIKDVIESLPPQDAPPVGMPQPIRLRMSATRSN